MAYGEKLAERVRVFFARRGASFEEKRMMGGLCFVVAHKMCVGVEKERLMARIDPDEYEFALRRKGCVPMDFTGRPMRGFVFVNREGIRSGRELAHWLELALDFNPRAKASRAKHVSKRSSQKISGQPVLRRAARSS
jgi:TfoX/Sxy family transcriptional regulator of competence genes